MKEKDSGTMSGAESEASANEGTATLVTAPFYEGKPSVQWGDWPQKWDECERPGDASITRTRFGKRCRKSGLEHFEP